MSANRPRTLDGAEFASWEVAAIDGNYEEVSTALAEVVDCLEEGGLSLDDAVRCYEVGVRLVKRSQSLLRNAELEISILDESLEEIQSVATDDFDLDDDLDDDLDEDE